jgi:hypothetical protein
MHRPTPPMTPNALPLNVALHKGTHFKNLWELMRESQARLAIVRSALPVGLHSHLQGGPVDGTGWTLLVANAAVAAKLRQLLPAMQEALRAQGRSGSAVRIKVLGHA